MKNKNDHHLNIIDLCRVILSLETEEETFNFLKDLCTPSELSALAERWQICKALDRGLSYRDVQAETGASLATIGRVARFMKNEPYQGYTKLLKKSSNKNKEEK